MHPIVFTIATYLLFGFASYLIIFRFNNQRDYWYALIGCALTFPLEWYAINYPNLMVYDIRYFMIFDRLPFWMIFAYGWFFGFPLVICLRLQDKIDAWPLWQRIVGIYTFFWVWDIVTEYSSTAVGFWVYYYPEEWMIGGILPWFIPTAVAFHNMLLYFGHKFALKYSSEKSWIHGFFIHLLTYYIIIGGNMLWHTLVVRVIFGIEPTIDLSMAP